MNNLPFRMCIWWHLQRVHQVQWNCQLASFAHDFDPHATSRWDCLNSFLLSDCHLAEFQLVLFSGIKARAFTWRMFAVVGCFSCQSMCCHAKSPTAISHAASSWHCPVCSLTMWLCAGQSLFYLESLEHRVINHCLAPSKVKQMTSCHFVHLNWILSQKVIIIFVVALQHVKVVIKTLTAKCVKNGLFSFFLWWNLTIFVCCMNMDHQCCYVFC